MNVADSASLYAFIAQKIRRVSRLSETDADAVYCSICCYAGQEKK